MKQIASALLLTLWLTPANAQEGPPLEDELRDFFGELTTPLLPLIDDLAGQLRDLSAYHAPEILPNGDILIRKRRPEDEPPENRPLPEREPEREPTENPDETIDL